MSWRSELDELSKLQAKTPAEQQAWAKGFVACISALEMEALDRGEVNGPLSPEGLSEAIRTGERRLAWRALRTFGTPAEWRVQQFNEETE
jgi:hypothetical protein